MPDSIQKKIENARTIAIYRHQRPDMDAIGSQKGLQILLQSLYPEKTVLACGNQSAFDQKMDPEIPRADLAIVLDTANAARVDGEYWQQAADSIRVDHHVKTETLCALEQVESDASATCEILALYCRDHGIRLPAEAAQWLYQGLSADNIRFTTQSTSEKSFEAAAYLKSQGADLIRSDLVNFGTSIKDYLYESRVRACSVYRDRFLYAVMEPQEYLSCDLSMAQAKEKVYVLGGVLEAEIWALFTRMEDGVHYSASLRSRHVPIRWIAQRYGGGGHENASGIKDLSVQDVYEIIELCRRESGKTAGD